MPSSCPRCGVASHRAAHSQLCGQQYCTRKTNSKGCTEVGWKPAWLCCIQGSLEKPGTKRGRLVQWIGGQLYEMAGRKCLQRGWSPLAGTFGSVSDNPWQCSWTFTYVRTTKAHCITADAKQPAGLCYCQSGRLALRGEDVPGALEWQEVY